MAGMTCDASAERSLPVVLICVCRIIGERACVLLALIRDYSESWTLAHDLKAEERCSFPVCLLPIATTLLANTVSRFCVQILIVVRCQLAHDRSETVQLIRSLCLHRAGKHLTKTVADPTELSTMQLTLRYTASLNTAQSYMPSCQLLEQPETILGT